MFSAEKNRTSCLSARSHVTLTVADWDEAPKTIKYCQKKEEEIKGLRQLSVKLHASDSTLYNSGVGYRFLIPPRRLHRP